MSYRMRYTVFITYEEKGKNTMQTVTHKIYGAGEVIGKEVKENGTYITVRFEGGKEVCFSIPESFTVGVLVAEGTLKEEVDAAIAEKTAREQERAQKILEAAKTSHAISARPRGRKHPRPVAVKGSIEAAYEEYLIRAGYKEETDHGDPSTVFSYLNAVNKVLEEEGISWYTLKNDIGSIVGKYDAGGEKELIGAKSNKTVINALKRFQDFINA